MKLIDDFRQRLLQINIDQLSTPIPDLSEEMARTTQKLRSEYGDISKGVANQKGISLAVGEYLHSQQLISYQDTKYVCFGVSSSYGLPPTRLIEHDSLFIQLLKQVESLQTEPRKFRRCYQGLLKAYFRYPGHQTENKAGNINWLLLRKFLAKHCKSLSEQVPVLEWTQALYDHRNLLSDDPCKAYGKKLLDGDQSVVDELKNRLGIDDDTWVMNELVLAQVQAAAKLKDADFVGHVKPLLELLDKHKLLITRGLIGLLVRYAACKEHPEHAMLRDVALREWKSPWLQAHKPIWNGHVGEEATEMVSIWLKKRTIRDFFELLQSDGQADRQRMEFWLQYAEQIDDIWLALGEHSLYNNRPDYKRIRQNMAGRYMELTGGNYAQDNAFLMEIGGFVFIEFGKQNNACHVFAANKLPFKFGQKSVLGTQEGLKNTNHPGHRKKLFHREGWQYDFTNFLRSYANAVPGAAKPKPKPTPKATSTNTSVSKEKSSSITQTKPNAVERAKPLTIEQVQVLCAANKLHFDDHRSMGGAFWVRVQETDPIISTTLKNSGFQYKKDKGWWRV